jgi:hypothetical protein
MVVNAYDTRTCIVDAEIRASHLDRLTMGKIASHLDIRWVLQIEGKILQKVSERYSHLGTFEATYQYEKNIETWVDKLAHKRKTCEVTKISKARSQTNRQIIRTLRGIRQNYSETLICAMQAPSVPLRTKRKLTRIVKLLVRLTKKPHVVSLSEVHKIERWLFCFQKELSEIYLKM